MSARDVSRWMWRACIAAVALSPAGCGRDAAVEQEIHSVKPSYELSANSLLKKYGKSQIDADAKFKGKVLLVTGNVSSTSAQIDSGVEVILKDKDEETVPGVRCMFAPIHKNQGENLHGEVSIKGRCDGWNMGVVLRGCTVE